MAASNSFSFALVVLIGLSFWATPAAAFGAGNIASISKIEGHNWRHGDIEDLIKGIAFLKGHKWTTTMVKRVYFGNWLRDYSQAVDVGTLKGVQADTIRILVWVLSFMSFGFATREFEVTADRLGTYRPEEHIDNPKDYADNEDARTYDSRLRPPVMPIELEIDPNTGMKNYIANEHGNWATSTGYVKYSLTRSIHFGRLYTHGSGLSKGNKADLHEALRCLGQALHCMEDFGAHTNYTELSLRELGFSNVFPLVGAGTEINLRGKRVYPLVTGTFGAVDFLHSVLGEATDHFTQSEVEELDLALGDAQTAAQGTSGRDTARGIGGSSNSVSQLSAMTDLLGQLPGMGGSLCAEAEELKRSSDAQEMVNQGRGGYNDINRDIPRAGAFNSGGGISGAFAAPPGSAGGPPGPNIPGLDINPQETIKKIYPILEFRDKVVRAIDSTIEKIPGLEALVTKITETVTLFVLSLLAPFIRPIIAAVEKSLKLGSSGVVGASAKHQYEVFDVATCSDPTHSLLSKDHFSNILNEPAGQVAGVILKYVAPRVIYAWQHPDVPVQQVLDDVVRAFHHPAIRDNSIEVQRTMFESVSGWVHSLPDRGSSLNTTLSRDGVRHGKNHTNVNENEGAASGISGISSKLQQKASGSATSGLGTLASYVPGFGKVKGSVWDLPGVGRGVDEGGLNEGPDPDQSYPPGSGIEPGGRNWERTPSPSISPYGSRPSSSSGVARPGSSGLAGEYYGGQAGYEAGHTTLHPPPPLPHPTPSPSYGYSRGATHAGEPPYEPLPSSGYALDYGQYGEYHQQQYQQGQGQAPYGSSAYYGAAGTGTGSTGGGYGGQTQQPGQEQTPYGSGQGPELGKYA